jgi:large subunit ribosomal protein L5
MAKAKTSTKSEVVAKVAKGEENPCRQIKIEKILLSAGAVDKELEKSKKLLELISKRKAQLIASSKRIPDFGVRPGLEVGARITIRGKEGTELLRRLLGAIDNILRKKQISTNHFSFGIHEYIDIPGMEYQRDIGIKGFNVSVVFIRQGVRVTRKKIKSGRLPKKQQISKEEIIKFMEDNFKTKFK